MVIILNTKIATQILQLAIIISRTGKAFPIMDTQEKLNNHLACTPYCRSIGLYNHSFTYRIHTGCLQCTATNVYYAYSASANLIYTLKVTQGWNMYIGLARGIKHGASSGNRHLHAVDRKIDHIFHGTAVLLLFTLNRFENARLHAGAALDTLGRIDIMRFTYLTLNSASRANLHTSSTSTAL